MDIKNIVSYSFYTTPPSLSNYDGTISKANESALRLSREFIRVVPRETHGTAIPIDGMAYLQQMKTVGATYGKFFSNLLKQLSGICRSNEGDRIDFISDRYPL